MPIESLAELKSAYDSWRSSRQNLRVPIPQALLERARQAAQIHGPSAVQRATKVPHGKLGSGIRGSAGKRKRTLERSAVVPAFSRLDLAVPSASSRPFAEVETPRGMKVRIFSATPETLALLSSLCGAGDEA
jgi:hypothetical protein